MELNKKSEKSEILSVQKPQPVLIPLPPALNPLLASTSTKNSYHNQFKLESLNKDSINYSSSSSLFFERKNQTFNQFTSEIHSHVTRSIQEIEKSENILKNEVESFEEQNDSSTKSTKFGAIIVSNFLQPILQHGPTCGLVAIGIASQLYKPHLDLSITFDTAKNLKYTEKGEMFSAYNLADLTSKLLECDAKVLNSQEVPLENILSHLLEGNLILVPYDADYNHSPAERNGNAAHWAVLKGFCIIELQENLKFVTSSDEENKNIFIKSPKDISETNKSKIINISKDAGLSDKIYIIARQGKSAHVGFWKYTDLLKSNLNLNEVGHKILKKSEEYMLHELKTNLSSRIIFLKNAN